MLVRGHREKESIIRGRRPWTQGVYCNRTPTALEQKWTEQESRRAENPKNPLDKRDFRQSRTQQETRDLTYKEGVAGSNSASPTHKTPAKGSILRAKRGVAAEYLLPGS